ncbi:MAG: hypothetical protein A2086_01690 [Spirochaetes bacterium GWD1_27_9]|nr:MAG: hypothetical protein A2Z98_04040 [Spirochaetes bacterium GWB1_27_13]OHD20618.1 MAG: hypothetical protein A2Y34_17520 [Spirochaetes bacterium GWC1_27_15]OHD41815.1 MAG: hypothetical protein A2086_01690 [Spirochaetes bacterium GWD1_27_9]
MKTLKNIIPLLSNGLLIMCAGYINDFLIKTFNIQSTVSKIIIIIGLIIIFLPLIFKVEVFETHESKEKSVMLFLKETHYTTKQVKQISLFGLLPIYTTDLKSEHTVKSLQTSNITNILTKLTYSFINGFTSWFSLTINLIKTK